MHVVAYFNAFDNTLEQFIVHGATTWKEALKDAYIQMLRNKNRDIDIEQNAQESIDSLPDDYEEACAEAFNQDWLFSVIEVYMGIRFIVLSKDEHQIEWFKQRGFSIDLIVPKIPDDMDLKHSVVVAFHEIDIALASRCYEAWVVNYHIPPEWNGVTLSFQEIDRCFPIITRYAVTDRSAVL